MTLERKIVVCTQDIKTISYECKACGARITFPPDKVFERIAEVCFSCGERWLGLRNPSPEQPFSPSAPVEMVRSIAQFRLFDRDGFYGFKVIMEFEEPGSSR